MSACWGGRLREDRDGPLFEPVALLEGGNITFSTNVLSTNLRDRKIQNEERVTIWEESDRRGENFVFKVTSITMLGEREFQFPEQPRGQGAEFVRITLICKKYTYET